MALIARLVVMFSGSFDGLWTRESMRLAIDGLVRPQIPPRSSSTSLYWNLAKKNPASIFDWDPCTLYFDILTKDDWMLRGVQDFTWKKRLGSSRSSWDLQFDFVQVLGEEDGKAFFRSFALIPRSFSLRRYNCWTVLTSSNPSGKVAAVFVKKHVLQS